ncbi:rhomboid family intramembrane serine protease [Tropicibacter alexandrii]|uniref:rhomboid family intramembrane serine protease n=1 Tax=Tropicibacter alexandrii TaxID=2267683 RepID=UPI000EF522AC|nr:rhomboid family intramembrane serine protease [Tropicibacter alexandrii]
MDPMQKAPHQEAPFNTVPPIVWALSLLMIGVEAAFWLGAQGLIGGPSAVGWRIAAFEGYGFSGSYFDWMIERGQYPLDGLRRFVTYPFLHGGFGHALFGAVITLAVGKVVADSLGQARVLLIFFAGAVLGALAWGLILSDTRLLVGAFPGAYGLIGAFTYLLFLKLEAQGAPRFRAFMLIGVLMGLQLVFGAFSSFASTEWFADLVGFAVGFGLTILLVPGGWGRLVSALRRR